MTILRLALLPLALISLPLLSGCGTKTHPSISLSPDSPSTLTIKNLDSHTLNSFSSLNQTQRAQLLQVHVADAPQGSPPLSGDLNLRGRELIFTPRYPFQPGLKYRAIFNPSPPSGKSQIANRKSQIHYDFSLPSPNQSPITRITAIYPSSTDLPENLLKFYIHFSSPMSRGEAWQRIALLDENNQPLPPPFLELAEELWNSDMTRFTLFFEPGRIKQGLVSREEMGPSLVAGRTYTLVIDKEWRDSNNRALIESTKKTFRTTAADHRQPDTSRWRITPPPGGSTQPLLIDFDEPMDHAMLQRILTIRGPTGKQLPGTLQIAKNEKRWSFIPSSPWPPGRHTLAVETTLEDLAGNSLARPFEVDLNRPSTTPVPPIIELPFQIRSAS